MNDFFCRKYGQSTVSSGFSWHFVNQVSLENFIFGAVIKISIPAGITKTMEAPMNICCGATYQGDVPEPVLVFVFF